VDIIIPLRIKIYCSLFHNSLTYILIHLRRFTPQNITMNINDLNGMRMLNDEQAPTKLASQQIETYTCYITTSIDSRTNVCLISLMFSPGINVLKYLGNIINNRFRLM
jgi:hypothetical protein